MKKIYFLQRLTSRAIYQLDLCAFIPNVNYINMFENIFKVSINNADNSLCYVFSNEEYYEVLRLLMACFSGYNKTNIVFKSQLAYYRELLGETLFEMFLSYLKAHYKMVATTEIYFNLNPNAYGKYR